MKKIIMKRIILISLITIAVAIEGATEVQSYEPSSHGKPSNKKFTSHNTQGRLKAVDRDTANRYPVRVIIAKQAVQVYRSAGDAVASQLGLPLETSEKPVPNALNIGPPEFARRSAMAKNCLVISPVKLEQKTINGPL